MDGHQRVGLAAADRGDVPLVNPTQLVSAERLNSLTGRVELSGDALVDSKTLYDPDQN